MKQIKAIGFDLFNTLITMDPHALDEAMSRLLSSLEGNDLALEHEAFKQAYWESTLRFLKKARQNGRETHNSFWISEALETLGYKIPADDLRITSAVDDYFSAFLQYCRLIPETIEMLESIKDRYRLGLLSNLTHAPAAIAIIEEMNLRPFLMWCLYPANWVTASHILWFLLGSQTSLVLKKIRFYLWGMTRSPISRVHSRPGFFLYG